MEISEHWVAREVERAKCALSGKHTLVRLRCVYYLTERLKQKGSSNYRVEQYKENNKILFLSNL